MNKKPMLSYLLIVNKQHKTKNKIESVCLRKTIIVFNVNSLDCNDFE